MIKSKQLSVCILATITGILWFLSQSQDYLPSIIAPYTQIHALLLGIFTLLFQIQIKNSKLKNILNMSWAFILAILSLYSCVNLIQCKIYPWCLAWIWSSFTILKNLKKQEQSKSVQQQFEFKTFNLANIRATIISGEDSLSQGQREKKEKVSLNNCCNNVIFLLIILLVCLYSLNCSNISYYAINYPIVGREITLQVPNLNHKVSIHYYCSDISYSKYPTIILQHGGGGNSIGFLPLLKDLESKGVKVCIYDRLGYGRSSKVIPNLSLKDQAKLTNHMWSLILRSNERVIYGGWSAGVELSIAYSYYHPQRIDGLVFMDGYPDYLLLEAIQDNSSTIRNPHTLLIADFFKFIEPYGLDSLFGKNQIQNQTINSYYIAYYRTGYFWDSQATELKYMNTTSEISEMGKETGAKIPYPNSKLYLNWPDISVPLLVMPASNTISSNQYKIQSQKYIQKCSNVKKRLQIIQGDHGYVLVQHKKISEIILRFLVDLE